ncbi:exonuclease domain-containing protein [Thioalkalivibrio sulfidiphilus]|uniref:exonuclease domain-containing protein n=1 Tax=Thioalkalivibrio sulfidiphilus TaxID=1033854 RepID=UPI0003665247|nr:exonuclease domain-containing protein [Thioalkalivibrio sulfidiphilus]
MPDSKTNPEIYVSTDIEADGPIPGPHSMLSLASVAYDPEGNELGSFSVNLETLEGAEAHPRMVEWWAQFPEAWDACRKDLVAPEPAMQAYADWIEALPGRAVFVGWPAGWDFMWVYWYLMRFTGRRPFHENALDIRTYAMALRRLEYRKSGKSYLPKRWFSEQRPHTHVALDDAREQGELFMHMLRENRRDET